MMMNGMAKSIVPAYVCFGVFPVNKKRRSISTQGKAAAIALRRTG